MEGGKRRQHSAEFRAEIARRMLDGESVTELSEQYKLARSMMYRWRDAYRELGPEGVSRLVGRPAGSGRSPGVSTTKSGNEDRLRKRIAELERTIGQQTAEIRLFRGVFKRLKDLPKANRPGGTASTRRSDE